MPTPFERSCDWDDEKILQQRVKGADGQYATVYWYVVVGIVLDMERCQTCCMRRTSPVTPLVPCMSQSTNVKIMRSVARISLKD
jgi:hypothetical protein